MKPDDFLSLVDKGGDCCVLACPQQTGISLNDVTANNKHSIVEWELLIWSLMIFFSLSGGQVQGGSWCVLASEHQTGLRVRTPSEETDTAAPSQNPTLSDGLCFCCSGGLFQYIFFSCRYFFSFTYLLILFFALELREENGRVFAVPRPPWLLKLIETIMCVYDAQGNTQISLAARINEMENNNECLVCPG